ncbi:MAG: AGE family epimerase/isomerase [Roseiarcus sp.]|jgi:mannose/cellobiose epimerase-like protein (N-acyl-D-glucosamine 2-epimerase family)
MSEVFEAKSVWRQTSGHRRWLAAEADALLAFYEAELIDPSGGFAALDASGRAMASERVRPLHETARMTHGFAIAHLLGRPGAAEILDHGVEALQTRHRDPRHGGYFWSFDDEGPRERDKLAYGHAFALLAAASAKCAGHPRADALLGDVAEVIETRFWEPKYGASAEEFAEDWSPLGAYRGQNANMHLTEALMAAFEATGERGFLDKAESIADRILRKNAAAADWRVPEHYSADWAVDRAYKGSDMFRPYGVTPGHGLEWARLALQLWELGGRKSAWLPEAARALFARAVGEGWDGPRGGFYYTLEWSGAPRVRDRLWWPCCEGIGAATFLGALDDEALYEDWYRRIWGFCARHFLDRRRGGWHCQLDDSLTPIEGYFVGKPDLYHALQACLIPLYSTDGSLTRGILRAPGGGGA